MQAKNKVPFEVVDYTTALLADIATSAEDFCDAVKSYLESVGWDEDAYYQKLNDESFMKNETN